MTKERVQRIIARAIERIGNEPLRYPKKLPDLLAVDSLEGYLLMMDYWQYGKQGLLIHVAFKEEDSFSIDELIFCLQSEDYQVRLKAAYILGELGDSLAVIPLSQALRDKSMFVREQAATALTKLSPMGWNEIVLALRDPIPEVRMVAADALSTKMPDRDDIFDILIEAVQDEDKRVFRRVVTKLVFFMKEKNPTHPQANATIISLMHDKNNFKRLKTFWLAINSLSVNEDFMEALLNDASADIRSAALSAFHSRMKHDKFFIPHKRLVEVVILRLADTSAEIRLATAKVLGDIPVLRTLDRDFYHPRPFDIDEMCRKVLTIPASEKVHRAVIQALGDEDVRIRYVAIQLAGKLIIKNAAEQLQKIALKDETILREAARLALNRLGM